MVIKRLTQALRVKNRSRTAEGERVYAIGDVHGRLDLLEALLRQIEQDDANRGAADTILIFLGDLVDRGPQSRGVIDKLIALKEDGHKIRVLAGNHDEVFLKALSGDIKALRFLTRIGGRETILSYGLTPSQYDEADYPSLAEILARSVPPEHLSFLQSMEDWAESGDYLFVHAGIRPDVPIAEQKSSDLRWIRTEFLDCRSRHPKLVIHGHTITASPDVRGNRIGIDTGAFATGKLTALGLEGEDRWFITASGEADARWGMPSD